MTGKRALLDAAIRYADCVAEHIGDAEGKIKAYPGHEIAEMALMRLYEITKEEKHLALAKYFVDQRGQKPLYFDEERKRKQRTKLFLTSVNGYGITSNRDSFI